MMDADITHDISDPVAIGKRLKAKREALGLTQVQLAEKLDVSPKTYIFYANARVVSNAFWR